MLLQRGNFFKHSTSNSHHARRFFPDVIAKSLGHVCAEHQGEHQHRTDRSENEKQKQLAIKAGANLVEERAQRNRLTPRKRRVHCPADQQ